MASRDRAPACAATNRRRDFEDKDADRSKLFQRYLTPEGYKPLVESLTKGEKSNQMQMVKMET